MKKILLPIVAALILFTTSALADHTIYTAGNIYRDSGLVACSTKEASLTVLQSMIKETHLTYGVTRRLSEANNCEFHRDPVTFVVTKLLCKIVKRDDKKTFTIARTLIKDAIETKFTILYTKSNTPDCEEQI